MLFPLMEGKVHVAGIFQYRGLAPMYYRGSGAAIVVYDITSEVSVVSDVCL